MRHRITVRSAVALAALLTAGPLLARCGGDKPSQPAAAGSGATPPATGAPAVVATPTTAASSTAGTGAAGSGSSGGLGKTLTFPKVRVGDVNLVAQATGKSVKVYDRATAKSPSRTMRSPL